MMFPLGSLCLAIFYTFLDERKKEANKSNDK